MPKDKKKKQDNQRVPSKRQSPSHNTKRYEFQTLIPTSSAEELAQATKRRQAMAPPIDDYPEDPKQTGSKTEKAKQVSDGESQTETPPLVLTKLKDAIPPDKQGDDPSDNQDSTVPSHGRDVALQFQEKKRALSGEVSSCC